MSPVEAALTARVPAGPATPPGASVGLDVWWLDAVLPWGVLLRSLPVGPRLERALSELPPLEDLDDRSLLEVAAAQQRLVAFRQARVTEAVAEFARRRTAPIVQDGGGWVSGRCSDEVSDFAAPELAARMGWTGRLAGRRLAEAERLTGCLPRTMAALRTGRIDYARAQVVVTATECLGEDGATEVDRALAGRVGSLTTAQLREAAATEVAAVDAAAAARRAEQGRRDRAVSVQPLPDGLAELCATGPAADIAAIFAGLTAAAGDRAPNDVRGVDARRFDALVGWAHRNLGDAAVDPTGGPGGGGGVGRLPVLIVAESTLEGADEHPGRLAGYGPLPARVARELASRGRRRRVHVDRDGILLAVENTTTGPPDDQEPPVDQGPPGDRGSPGGAVPTDDQGLRDGHGGAGARGVQGAAPATTREALSLERDDRHGVSACPTAAAGGGLYRPLRGLERLVRIRDGDCTFPGCRVPAARCDLDHVIRHPDGPTCACNLQPLCRRHHRMKHHSATTVWRDADGTTTWRLPAGHTYRVPPRPVLARPAARAVARPDSARDEPLPPERPKTWDTAAYGHAALTRALHAADVRSADAQSPDEAAARHVEPPPS